ncbi:MAG TPA: efflux transporter outer membrane subunit [Sphingomonadaceae bacterium]|nr:efflux transporter outer membrane subunit [Sphingomonadaceae bacterium]
MRFRLFLPLPFLALAACTVGPDYERPQSAAAPDWLEPASTAPVSAAWWQQFGDTQLTALVERALASSPDIRQATARIAEARALREAAQGGRMPQVNMTRDTSLNRISENGQIPVGNIPGFDPEFPLIDSGFDASWEMDTWGRASREVERARAVEDAAQWAQRDAIVSLTAEIARTYVDFRLAQEQLATARTEQEAGAQLAELSALRAKAGEASRIEAEQANAEREVRSGAVAQAQADVSGAAYRLAALVGIPPEEIVPGLIASTGRVPVAGDDIASGIRSDLLERRPDIRRAEMDLAAATAGIGVAKADLYPRFTLQGSIGLQAQSPGDLLTGESLRYMAGGFFRWPIFSFGRIRAQIRAADARADGAAAAYEGAIIQALAETEGAANRFAASAQSGANAATALKREEEAWGLARMLFERGETNRLQLEQARMRLTQAQRQDAQSRAGKAASAIALYKALGGAWEADQASNAAQD